MRVSDENKSQGSPFDPDKPINATLHQRMGWVRGEDDSVIDDSVAEAIDDIFTFVRGATKCVLSRKSHPITMSCGKIWCPPIYIKRSMDVYVEETTKLEEAKFFGINETIDLCYYKLVTGYDWQIKNL